MSAYREVNWRDHYWNARTRDDWDWDREMRFRHLRGPKYMEQNYVSMPSKLRMWDQDIRYRMLESVPAPGETMYVVRDSDKAFARRAPVFDPCDCQRAMSHRPRRTRYVLHDGTGGGVDYELPKALHQPGLHMKNRYHLSDVARQESDYHRSYAHFLDSFSEDLRNPHVRPRQIGEIYNDFAPQTPELRRPRYATLTRF